MRPRRDSQYGLALINALIIVAALSSVAVLVLQRGHGARVRQSDSNQVAQIQSNLEGAETLARLILDADRATSEADHLGESWAQKNYTVALGRGQVQITMTDMQAKFNLNWLTASDAVVAPEAFKMLMRDLGLPDTLRVAIEQWLSEDGPDAMSRYLNRNPRIIPRGGAVNVMDELRHVAGMTPRYYAKLSAYVSAYSPQEGLNINTASLPVLRAFLSALPPSIGTGIIEARTAEPFENGKEITLWFQSVFKPDDYEKVDIGRFVASSRWFDAQISAKVDNTYMVRRVVFKRSGETGKTRVKYRLITRPLDH
ncbi:MAG: hypothetical protein COB84_02155 [Rhodobacteraceae bacterium]|nr:MAG: hypothetical protein COB84_02155 [Paracoccaceae bacterium]